MVVEVFIAVSAVCLAVATTVTLVQAVLTGALSLVLAASVLFVSAVVLVWLSYMMVYQAGEDAERVKKDRTMLKSGLDTWVAVQPVPGQWIEEKE